MKEYEIFKTNNISTFKDINNDIGTVNISINNFIKRIPLGVIYKDYKLNKEQNIELILDYINADDDTRLYIHLFIELCTLEYFNRYMMSIIKNIRRTIGSQEYKEKNTYYNISSEIHRMIEQSSIRNRPDIVDVLYSNLFKYYPKDKLIPSNKCIFRIILILQQTN